MERLRARDLRLVLATLEELASVAPLADFPATALAAAERLVPCDHSGYNEVESEPPRARVIINPPEAAFPGVAQLFAEHAQENPLLVHMQRTGDMAPVKFTDFISARQLHRLSLYNLVYRPIETEYQMAFELVALPVVGITLSRHDVDFSERDRAVLEALRPHLRRAFLTAATIGRLGDAVEQGGRAAVVVGRDGAVQMMTQQALTRLAAFFPNAAGTVLPDEVAGWLRRRQAFRQIDDDLPSPPEPLVVVRNGARLVIAYLAGRTPAEPDLLLLGERPADPARRFGLTARETLVVERLARGLADAEIAQVLAVSTRTVQVHLQRIYRKLGVSSRTAALARLGQALREKPRT